MIRHHHLFALVLLLAQCPAHADNWPFWRGPAMDGHSRETGLPLVWSDTRNVRWKTPLPGPGMSSPVVWGGRVFLTQALDREGRRRALLCFDRRDGRELWRRAVDYAAKEATYDGEPHYCSGSPAVDGQVVVASFGSAGVLACDLRGRELWRRDLGVCRQIWGTASSPILHRNLVILNFGPGERTFLVALDKRTGKDVWRVDIPGGKFGETQADWLGSWATPVVARVGSREELIAAWPGAVTGYDPMTGRARWTSQGVGPLVYNSPLVTEDSVIVLSGFGGPALAVRAGGKGDVTATHRLWREERTTQRIGSGAVVGDHLYIVNENGVAQCVDRRTGKTLWTERAAGSTWSSLVCADGRLYVTDQRGETVVLAAKPVFEVLARNPLNERTQSSLAISGGCIYIRTYAHLWCIGGP